MGFHYRNKNIKIMENNRKYALITGGTSGIGYELAKLFANDNYNLIIVARNENELFDTERNLTSTYPIDVLTIKKDLMDPDGPFELYDEIQCKGIDVDVLVNNAGQGQYGLFSETSLARELDIINLNIVSYVVLTKFFLRDMLAKNEGKILNVSSIGGNLPAPMQSVYHATKAFITSFTEAIHYECKDTNVSITALLPGVTDTDFFRKAEMEDVKMVAEGKKDDPAEVALAGFEALMSGKDKVIYGLRNKAYVAEGNILPDQVVAAHMNKQMQPVEK